MSVLENRTRATTEDEDANGIEEVRRNNKSNECDVNSNKIDLTRE